MLGFVVSPHKPAGRAISIADSTVVLRRSASKLMITTYNLEDTGSTKNFETSQMTCTVTSLLEPQRPSNFLVLRAR